MLKRIGFIVVTIALLLMQAKLQSAPIPKVPVITIVQKDGKVTRGQISIVDRDTISVTPIAKPNSNPAEPINIAWSDIRSVSDGLTQPKAFVQWKADHREQLCETCKGEGTVLCATCKGTGHDPASLDKNCPTCHGELLVDCKAPKCEKGKVPCPGNCLKLTEGVWTNKDGKKVRYFHYGRYTYWFSENHLGHLVGFDPSSGPVDKGPCPLCGGTTKVDCPICHGLGKVPCKTCSENTAAAACPAHCNHGRTACPTCGGTGLKKT